MTTFTTYYKNVTITLNIEGKNQLFLIDHEDLKGEYVTLELAKKAINEWVKPTEKVKKYSILIANYDHNQFEEATTSWTYQASHGGTRYYWVTYSAPKHRKQRCTESLDRLYEDTPQNRQLFANIAVIKDKQDKAYEEAEAMMDKAAGKLTNAKPQ